MKIRLSVFLIIAALFLSCTPEIEDDYVRLEFSDNTDFMLYSSDSSDAALVKVNYYASPSRNGVNLGDTIYTANVLFGKRNDEGWRYVNTLSSDSFLTVVKRTGEIFSFAAENMGDTLFYSVDLETGELDTLAEYGYFSALEFDTCDSTSTAAIKSLSMYKTYSQWKDAMINLYR